MVKRATRKLSDCTDPTACEGTALTDPEDLRGLCCSYFSPHERPLPTMLMSCGKKGSIYPRSCTASEISNSTRTAKNENRSIKFFMTFQFLNQENPGSPEPRLSVMAPGSSSATSQKPKPENLRGYYYEPARNPSSPHSHPLLQFHLP